MPTSEDVLTLTQWLSPGYPVGAFAYSHGLEAAAAQGRVRAGTLEAWLTAVLRSGSGRADAILLTAAFNARDTRELHEIDQTARAFAPSRERLFETLAMGEAFMQITAELWQFDTHALTYPVAIGFAASKAGIDGTLTCEVYLQAFLANLISGAQRLLPLGQTRAQAMLRRFAPVCIELAGDCAHGDLTNLSSATFLSDIASMQHETQTSRIFRT